MKKFILVGVAVFAAANAFGDQPCTLASGIEGAIQNNVCVDTAEQSFQKWRSTITPFTSLDEVAKDGFTFEATNGITSPGADAENDCPKSLKLESKGLFLEFVAQGQDPGDDAISILIGDGNLTVPKTDDDTLPAGPSINLAKRGNKLVLITNSEDNQEQVHYISLDSTHVILQDADLNNDGQPGQIVCVMDRVTAPQAAAASDQKLKTNDSLVPSHAVAVPAPSSSSAGSAR